jgi:hypothetical protein
MLATIALVVGGFVLVVVRAQRRGASGDGGYRPTGVRWTEPPQ